MPLDLSAFAKRAADAAQDLAEAVSLGAPPKPPQGAPGAPPAGPGAAAPPPMPSAPVGPLQGSAPPSLAVRPVTPPNPLEMMPAFKSPTFASMLQGEVGRQGPVGFAEGGRVNFACR